jgi:class 3 adenylate cyclase
VLDNERNEIRLFLEEICCEIARARHMEQDGLNADAIAIHREVALGQDRFADIVVTAQGRAPYAIEVKVGHGEADLVAKLTRKYGPSPVRPDLACVVVLIRRDDFPSWNATAARIRAAMDPLIELVAWDIGGLAAEVERYFAVTTPGLDGRALLEARRAIDRAKWLQVYGDDDADSPLMSTLLWHFGPWTLDILRRDHSLGPADVLRPGTYHDVCVLMGDLSGFSGYVRDTVDERVVRDALTSFYSNARFAIHAAGGMVYQFIGDSVVGLFGLPIGRPADADRALACARRLGEIGRNVTLGWQERIDRVQKTQGAHVGLTIGDLTLVPHRPFSQTHVGFVGDSLNMAARLLDRAGPGEILVGNTLFRHLSAEHREGFTNEAPIEARNVGSVLAWRRPL